MTMSKHKWHVCGPYALYRFKGFLFEVHSYHGPNIVNEDGDPLDIRLHKEDFWLMWEEFDKLPQKEKEKYKTHL